jgi:hypothetical protein
MNKYNKIIIPLLVIVLLNLIEHGFYLISIERPVFYYEYLAIPFVFTFISKKLIRLLIITFIVISDAIISLAQFYFFDTFNYITKIPSFFNSHFSFSFWLSLAGFIIIIGFIIYITTKLLNFIKSDDLHKIFYTKFLIVVFICVYFIDIITGNSFFYFRTVGNNHTNFSQSAIMHYYNDAKIFSKKYGPVSSIDNYPKNSITYKYFYNDSAAHQILIVLESWGYIKNKAIRLEQMDALTKLKLNGYKVVTDSSTFQGGTSQAEARELLNKSGEAYYSIIQNHPKNTNSIIEHKNKMGYYTNAFQAFSGFHSSGFWFRKSLGFETMKDLKYFKDSLHAPVNYNNHYEAVNDEIVFEYGIKKAFSNGKSFTYILTINTHLPFKGNANSKILTNDELEALPSQEAKEQYARIKEQFNFIAELLKKYPIDKLVIVGDHPPPFIKNSERAFYSKKLVPAIILSRQ